MKKILVPTDFTPASRNAAEYAASLANALGASVHLLYVYTELIPPMSDPETGVLMLGSMMAGNEALMAKEIEWLRSVCPIQVSGSITSGFKGDAIRSAADEMGASLVVMGRKNDRSKLFGSTVTRMIRKSDRPVLVIPEGVIFRPVKYVVLAVDFNEMIVNAYLKPLLMLVRSFDSSLKVVHVEKKGAELKVAEVPEKMQMGRALSAFNYVYDRVEYDNVEFGILDYVQNHPADLLAMIAHQHTIFERIFGAVHTKAVSLHINLPLLVLKTPWPSVLDRDN